MNAPVSVHLRVPRLGDVQENRYKLAVIGTRYYLGKLLICIQGAFQRSVRPLLLSPPSGQIWQKVAS